VDVVSEELVEGGCVDGLLLVVDGGIRLLGLQVVESLRAGRPSAAEPALPEKDR
jgi:hypothetical protein